MRSIIVFFVIISNLYAQNGLSNFVQNKPVIEYNNENDYSSLKYSSPLNNKHSGLNLFGQAAVGTTLAVGFSFLPTFVSYLSAFGGGGSNTTSSIFAVMGVSTYIFGAAVGVHWLAKSENPDLSFWKTVGYSAIGGGVGIGIASIVLKSNDNVSVGEGLTILLCPIISSMLYASFISDWPQDYQKVSLYKNNYSHKDLVERTNLMNIEVLRIKL